jgi:hypothetical protein
MERRTDTKANDGLSKLATPVKALLLCGAISSLLYVGGDILAATRWEGYSYANQAVSELNAIGAPTRPLMLFVFAAYNLLVIAFAAGVWTAAGEMRSLRIAAVMLVVYALVGEVTNLFSPMSLRGTPMAANDVGHIVLTTLEVLSIVAFIALGSGARGRGFRIYSILTIVTLMVAGAVVGGQASHMTAAASSTPWAGILERVNIYGTMLWVLSFGAVLLRARSGREDARAAAVPAVVHAATLQTSVR